MNLAQLNAKIRLAVAPFGLSTVNHRVNLEYLRDERLGILGVHAGQEPTEAQVDLVNAQLFGEEAQRELL